MTNRSWNRLDRYAMFDISRKCHLSAIEFTVLYALCQLADYRSREWQGTAIELAEHVPSGRNSVMAGCNRMSEIGLIVYVKPFGQNRSATVSVECYSQVIVETVGPRGRSKVLDVNSSKLSETTEVSPELSSERNEVAGSEAFDQELRRSLRDGGMEVESESDVFFSEGTRSYANLPPIRLGPPCPNCGKPTSNAPFGLNCDCPF